MAVIDELGVEVKVIVNGTEATEYIPDEEPDFDDDNFDPSTKTCCRYVESIDNADFAIRAAVTSGRNKPANKWLDDSKTNGLSFSLSFDGGDKVAGLLINQNRRFVIGDSTSDAATCTKRNFRFASVSTVDDANKQRIASDMETAKDLGLIRVVVKRVKFTGNKIRQPSSSRDISKLASRDFSLAEKALKGKAISHGTTLAPPVKCPVSGTTKTLNVDRSHSPFAVFYFKYRSKEALQQELIIPRPRSLSIESDVENLSAAELRRLARERLSQMKGDKKRAARIKDEGGEAPSSSRPYKFIRIEGGKKAIDLTEDD